MPLDKLLFLVLFLVVMAAVFAPRFLAFVAERVGVDATATVISATTSAVMDENKRYYKELELDVTVPGGPTFRKKVRTHLPWFSGTGPSAGTRLKVRVLSPTRSVAVLGPDRELPTDAAG